MEYQFLEWGFFYDSTANKVISKCGGTVGPLPTLGIPNATFPHSWLEPEFLERQGFASDDTMANAIPTINGTTVCPLNTLGIPKAKISKGPRRQRTMKIHNENRSEPWLEPELMERRGLAFRAKVKVIFHHTGTTVPPDEGTVGQQDNRTHAVTSGCEIRQATLVLKPGFFLELIIWLLIGP